MFLVINDNEDNDNNDDDEDDDQLFLLYLNVNKAIQRHALLYLIRMTMRYKVILEFISFRLTT